MKPDRDPPLTLTLPRSGDWWPGGLGHPNRVDTHAGRRYAVFARARRLAIELDGEVLLLDTQDHVLGEPLAEAGAALQFATPNGPLDPAALPVLGRMRVPS